MTATYPKAVIVPIGTISPMELPPRVTVFLPMTRVSPDSYTDLGIELILTLVAKTVNDHQLVAFISTDPLVGLSVYLGLATKWVIPVLIN